jgi:hypothetical protein
MMRIENGSRDTAPNPSLLEARRMRYRPIGPWLVENVSRAPKGLNTVLGKCSMDAHRLGEAAELLGK